MVVCASAAAAILGLGTTYPQLAPFSIPVAVIDAHLASMGLLNVFISNEGPIETLLFPNESMSCTTSAGVLFDDANDLEMIRQDIKDSFEYTREGKKEGLRTSTYKLSTFIQGRSLWTKRSKVALDPKNHSPSMSKTCPSSTHWSPCTLLARP